MQPIYTQVDQHSNIVFKKFTNFEFLQKTENCLLIFGDSFEEILDDKEFVNLATGGRHKNINVIYVKHNLYQQSKRSRTIDLNTIHIILFKSPRDVQQVEFLGKQLNLNHFLKNCYEIATREKFGHLLIDLDPKTLDCLRFFKHYRAWTVGVLHTFRQSRYYSHIKWTRKKSLYWSEWYFYLIPSWGNFSALPTTILYWYCVNVFTTSSEDMWKFRLIIWSNMKTWSRLFFVKMFQLKRKEPYYSQKQILI